MPATSVAVHAPAARRSNSVGDGAIERLLSVSSVIEWPDGVTPTNRSSLTNRTIAFTFFSDIDLKLPPKRITHRPTCHLRSLLRLRSARVNTQVYEYMSGESFIH